MAMKYRTSFKAYAAWNYQREIDDLNRSSEEGWQLAYGGCFHSKFVRNSDVRYRYQLDYRKVEDMGRYIETFREQGWEYVNSTFNGWHYFRKLYDPSLPEAEYEIFTDRESLLEMNRRWSRLAFLLSAIIGLFALISVVRMILRPCIPPLFQTLILLIESLILLRGGLIMRNPDSDKRHGRDGALLSVFLLVVVLGCGAGIALTDLRPNFDLEQKAEELTEPVVDNDWINSDICYPDFYYLDLEVKADAPVTFEITNSVGKKVYTVTEAEIHADDIRMWLTRGNYQFSMSADAAFDVKCSMD